MTRRIRQALAAACLLAAATAADAGPYVFKTVDYQYASETFAFAVNNHGTVTGYYVEGPFDQVGFRYAAGTYGMIFVPLPNADETYAYGINDAGTIVGAYHDWTDFPPQSFGFSYQGGSYGKLILPAGSIATDINNLGTIVGLTGDHGVILAGSTITTFDAPGAVSTHPNGINDSGLIVGSYYDGTTNHGFLDEHGSIVGIDAPGASGTVASAINNAGVIVGYTSDTPYQYPSLGTNQHGFIDVAGTFTTFDVPGASETELLGINDEGWLVGAYYAPRTFGGPGLTWHGFLAIPESAIPEPATLSLMAAGILVLRSRRRRKGVS